jgi:hypothetical protein
LIHVFSSSGTGLVVVVIVVVVVVDVVGDVNVPLLPI